MLPPRNLSRAGVPEAVAMVARVCAFVLMFTFTIYAAEVWPADVQSFIDDRTSCDHFRGEPWHLGDEPEIKARREFIIENLNKYCTGTDKRLADLRSKYKDNPTIIDRLRNYEDHIEGR